MSDQLQEQTSAPVADVVTTGYEVVPVDRLTPHPRNPRRGNVDAIRASIRANGFFGAVLVQQGTDVILAGEHRWMAAKAEGLAEIPVLYAVADEDEALRIVLSDNRPADLAVYDDQALAVLLRELAAEERGLVGTGWDDDALRDLLALTGDLGRDAASFLDSIAAQPGSLAPPMGGELNPTEDARQLTFSLADAERALVVEFLRKRARDRGLPTMAAALVDVARASAD